VDEIIQRAIELPWGYILSTLVIRFVGVFIVLAILMVGMQLLGAVVSRLVAMQEAKRSRDLPQEKKVALAESPELESREEELAAAIGAALAFSMESVTHAQPVSQRTGVDGSWALAGRVALMGRRLPAGTQRHG
jgi:Na+-transporting methylmalonyl-CoA/oxaloacetate decarboxylase gamma subunit